MIKTFQDKNLNNLVEKINNFEKQNKVFATNFFPPTPWSEDWCALAFYVEQDSNKSQDINLMTGKQANYIKKNEKELIAKGFDIQNIQTKADAFKIISEFEKIRRKD